MFWHRSFIRQTGSFKDPRFGELAKHLRGPRVLRQDPLKILCSSNNNIARITKMVDLGLGDIEGFESHQFPEAEFRKAGFGFRAKYITGTVNALQSKPGGGNEWLLSLRQLDLQEAVAALPGVGPKMFLVGSYRVMMSNKMFLHRLVSSRMMSSKVRAELPNDALSEEEIRRIKTRTLDVNIVRRIKDLSFEYNIPVNYMKYMKDVIISDRSILKEKGTVHKIVNNIVVHNVRVGPEDEYLFKKDFKRYMNETDGETKRDAALELFRSLVNGKSLIVRAEVHKLMTRSTRKLRDNDGWSSWKWRDKECGFRLATCLVELGALDVEDFLQEYNTPILLFDINKAPMVRAAALKLLFVALRTGKISISWGLVDVLGRNVGARSNVVHSYAANCIKEIMLVMKKKGGKVGIDGRHVLPLMVNLFMALKLPGSEENEYLMKCIFQVLTVSEINGDIAELCFTELTSLLSRTCQKPKNAEFNENVFLSLAVLVQRACERDVSQENRLIHVLGIIKELISSPSTDEHGFYVLKALIQKLDYSKIAPYMQDVWDVLFSRLVNKETGQFQHSLVIFMSLFLVKHGPTNLVDTVNSVRPDIFISFVRDCWVPHLKLNTGTNEVKLTLVAATILICESQALLDPSANELWGEMLGSIVQFVSHNEQELSKNAPANTRDGPLYHFCSSLAELSSKYPETYPTIIEKSLSHANLTYLLKLCSDYNCVIFKEKWVSKDGEKTQ